MPAGSEPCFSWSSLMRLRQDQDRSGTYLLSSSSWLDRSTFSFRTLSTSSRARCSFSSASATYWAPSEGQDRVSLLLGTGSQVGEGWVWRWCKEPGLEPSHPYSPASPSLTGTVDLDVREEGRLSARNGNLRSTCPQYLPPPSALEGLRPTVLSRPLSRHTHELGLSNSRTRGKSEPGSKWGQGPRRELPHGEQAAGKGRHMTAAESRLWARTSFPETQPRNQSARKHDLKCGQMYPKNVYIRII